MILELLPEVQKLPAAQKRQLAEELLRTADDADLVEVDPVILALLDTRLAAYDADPSAVAPWDEVSTRVFRQHVP